MRPLVESIMERSLLMGRLHVASSGHMFASLKTVSSSWVHYDKRLSRTQCMIALFINVWFPVITVYNIFVYTNKAIFHCSRSDGPGTTARAI